MLTVSLLRHEWSEQSTCLYCAAGHWRTWWTHSVTTANHLHKPNNIFLACSSTFFFCLQVTFSINPLTLYFFLPFSPLCYPFFSFFLFLFSLPASWPYLPHHHYLILSFRFPEFSPQPPSNFSVFLFSFLTFAISSYSFSPCHSPLSLILPPYNFRILSFFHIPLLSPLVFSLSLSPSLYPYNTQRYLWPSNLISERRKNDKLHQLGDSRWQPR